MIYFKEPFFNFLNELERTNNKDWFDANRKWYETDVKEPFDLFTKDLLEQLLSFDSELNSDYKKSIFRINRDIRFSKDKTPYKTNRSAAFSKFAKKDTESPGYYIEINAKKCFIAGGAWLPNAEHLKKIRQEIYYNTQEFNELVERKAFKKTYETIRGDRAKRLTGDVAEYAKECDIIYQKQFYFYSEFDPKECVGEDFLSSCVEKFKLGYPINQFLRRAMND